MTAHQKFLIIAVSAFFFKSSAVRAQSIVDVNHINSKIEQFKSSHSFGAIYSHFDKTIYTNNEDIWFTAYLLNYSTIANYNTLSVALVNDQNRHVTLQELFNINGGLSFGHLTLPDTIAPGNYHILLFTNVLDRKGSPTEVFSQPITIKTTREAHFKAYASLLDTIRDSNGNLKVVIKVESDVVNSKRLSTIKYSLGNKVTFGKIKNDEEYTIILPKTSGDLLTVAINQGDEEQFLNVKLPVEKKAPIVHFFPESGNLAEGVTNLVGWEAKLSTGEPVKIKCVLCKNNVAIDTLETNYYGIGKFSLLPEKSVNYSLKLIKAGSFLNVNDTTYHLPSALSSLPTIHISNVLAEDTLNLQISGSKKQTAFVLIHNYKEIVAYKRLMITPAVLKLKILLNDAPKGITTVTLLDSLGNPLAERIFFAHYQLQNTLLIKSDKSEYAKREKVTLKIELKNSNLKAEQAILSVACVQDNRIESDKQTDIETYLYLKHELQKIPSDPLGKNYKNREFVSDILLVRGWRRYKWADVMLPKNTDTLKADSNVKFWGTTTISNRPLKKAIVVTVSNSEELKTVNTDRHGRFELLHEQLIVKPGKKITVMAAGDDPQIYSINVKNPYQEINSSLSKELDKEVQKLSRETNTNEQKISGFEKTIALKEVIIKDNKDQAIYGITGTHKVAYCPDYICVNGILNCPNHVNDYHRKPEIGRTYNMVRNGTFAGLVEYTGCTVPVEENLLYRVKLSGINMPKEFYPVDESLLNNPEPEFLSTLYWNYGLKIENNKSLTLSFYTGDITGRFRVVVQGAGEAEVFSNQTYFMVTKK
jgi:hypothetical protein